MGKKKKKRKPGKPYNSNPYVYELQPYDNDDYLYGDKYAQWDWQGYLNCHKGNTKVLSTGRDMGGSLFIGGWSRGAEHPDDMTVFDMTGNSPPKTHTGTYYQITIDDFDVPQWSMFFWESMAMVVYNELSHGDVLVACAGGHGRSGMFVAIVSYILSDKRYIRIHDGELLKRDPLLWLRKVHCHDAVETVAQELCVYETCLAHKDNSIIREELDIILSKPRHVYKPVKYQTAVNDYANDEHDELEGWMCPICLSFHNTMIQALMCCSTKDSLRYCPVCLTKKDLPIEAYNCCKSVELS